MKLTWEPYQSNMGTEQTNMGMTRNGGFQRLGGDPGSPWVFQC